MKNKRYLWISLILLFLIIQVKIGGNILNNYEQRIKSMQHTVNTLETKANVLEVEVKNNKDSINNIHIQEASRGTPRTLEVVATAYTWTGEQTTSGTWPEIRRTIAVDRNIIPLNSLVYIESNSDLVGGLYVAEDCGGSIQGYKIDVFMSSDELANRFGVQKCKVTILKQGVNNN